MNIPSPEAALSDLSRLLPIVYSALEYGTYKAREFFDQQEDHTIDPYLAAHLVRFHALAEIRRAGHNASEEDDDFDLGNVPNSGILISYGRYNIRILKSTKEGELPAPGHSISRQSFYHQMSLPFPNRDGELPPVNLILLWDVMNPYDLGKMILACPKAGGMTRDSVEAHWYNPIPDACLLGKDTDHQKDGLRIQDLPISVTSKTESGRGDLK
jgi:hypothetical protein